MQNIINKSYINKVINIKSEVLFREAEDDFYYFNKINSAMKKLKQAIELTPSHFKSVVLYADILFMKGHIKKALELYIHANELSVDNAKVVASIANCYSSLKQYDESLEFCNKAIKLNSSDNYSLFSQLIEIKINNLVALKRYKEAYVSFIQSQNVLDAVSLKSIYTNNYETLNEKIKLQEKLHYSGLKIV